MRKKITLFKELTARGEMRKLNEHSEGRQFFILCLLLHARVNMAMTFKQPDRQVSSYSMRET